MRFLIYSAPYDELSGGILALHQLCHVLNALGEKAEIFPTSSRGGAYLSPISTNKNALEIIQAEQDFLKKIFQRPSLFKTNPYYLTPLSSINLSDIQEMDDLVVIYPENIFGNPLGAKHVARWLLHNPGHWSKEVFYTFDEVQFPFNNDFKPLNVPFLEVSNFNLTVTLRLDGGNTYLENYEKYSQFQNRTGSAYLIKKAKNDGLSSFNSHPSDAICLDQLSRDEIIQTFKRIKTFYSYDIYSFYSQLAVVYGANSVIIPRDAIEYSDFRPNPTDRLGVAYGRDDLERAINSSLDLVEHMDKVENQSYENVHLFREFWRSKLN